MASPAVSTPSSAGSPAAISIAPTPPGTTTPRTSISVASPGMASLAPNGPVPACNGPMTKTWVLPPRPKPGRKPATDTPPTKRKAQNRAAQRAFRERRAARVGELEEQLKETEEQRLQREQEMSDRIEQQTTLIESLEAKVKHFNDETKAWAQRYAILERALSWEKHEKDVAHVELSYLRHGSSVVGTQAVPLPPRRLRQQPSRQNTVTVDIAVDESEPAGCGGCTADTNCACLDAVMGTPAEGCGSCTPDHCVCMQEILKDSSNDNKRPASPAGPQASNKRIRPSIELDSPLEMDFTTIYTRPQAPVLPPPISTRTSQDFSSVLDTVPHRSAIDRDGCGFCTNDTYCLCEAAAAEAQDRDRDRDRMDVADLRMAPLLSEVTPPPSEADVTSSDQHKLPVYHPNTNRQPILQRPATTKPAGCSGVPGSCTQCQEDPRSGLFCRSLARLRSFDPAAGPDAGCCGGSATNGGGCCKTPKAAVGSTAAQGQSQLSSDHNHNNNITNNDISTRPPVPLFTEPSLSCADAYQTIKTHPNFENECDQLGTWLPKLEMVERAGQGNYPGRSAYEVRAASVMSVLKDFDVRFLKEAGGRR